ncbi:MAG TPA: RtcB family protein, partial [Syntrophorhabdaceae bacterium]|nr:RtcB family protein [Syntrophorhabdaceae bacterium]
MEEKSKYIKRLDENRYIIEKHGNMNVDGIVYVNDELFQILGTDESIKQVENVACLPGIVGASMAMPDIHWGYGFPIGGVAAFDMENGVVSPGGVGYDI